MRGGSSLEFSLYAETGLQNSSMPEAFIDPFKDIERYGPLGDPFSLSVLTPGEHQDHRVSMIHRDSRHNYDVSVDLADGKKDLRLPCTIKVRIDSRDSIMQPWKPWDQHYRTDMDEDGRNHKTPRWVEHRDTGTSAAPIQRHPYWH